MTGQDPHSTPLLHSRLSPSTAVGDFCPRDALLARLERAQAPLRLLQAPAGFGKTELLRQWSERLHGAGAVTAWLTLDRHDSPQDLLAYLAFALHRGGVIAASPGELAGEAVDGEEPARGVARLLLAVERDGVRCTLVLDAVDELPEPVLWQVIDPLLRLRPALLEICLACRRPPALRLSRYLVDGSLQLIDARALQFSRRELRDWLAERLPRRELEALVEAVEGWPVALRLLQSGGAGTAAYLEEQVLSGLSDEARCFLRDSALLERVEADAVAFVREAPTPPGLWEELRSALDGLWTRRDGDKGFRLHGLLREQLRDALSREAPARHAVLNHRAALWMVQRDWPVEGIHHAIAAGDPEHAARIFEQLGGARLWLHEGMDRINRILALLEPYPLRAFPRVQLARSLAHAKQGQMEKARAAFEEASRVSEHFRRDHGDGDALALLVDGCFIELLLTEYGCAPRPTALDGPAWERVLRFSEREPALMGYIRTLRCLWHTQTGRFSLAFEHGQAAIDIFRRGDSPYGELFIHMHLGMTELGRGRVGAALEEHQRALRIVRAVFPGDRGVRRICNIALGEAYWELGDDASARRYLRNVIRHINQPEAWFDLYMAAYQTSLEFLFAEGGGASADQFFREASEHASRQGLSRLERFLGAAYILCLFRVGREEEARAAANRLGAAVLPRADELEGLTWREAEVLVLAASETARAAGDLHGARAALAWGEDFAGERAVTRMQLHCLVQSACLEHGAGNEAQAQGRLREALALASGSRYLRPFLREGRRLRALAATLEGDRGTVFGPAILQRQLLDPESGHRGARGRSALSRREQEVLAALARGEPDKVIARNLGLSAHGVRYHLKKLYGRLGVQNRTQAVSRARERGWLDDEPGKQLISRETTEIRSK
ncbi:MAG: LuxR C-terminal-related transcriptional regulator [Pseudohaliea sp.]